MRPEEIIRSWKDEPSRLGMSDKELALLPDHPAGVIELTDAELDGVHGGSVITVCSFMLCETLITFCPTAITFCIPTWGFCPL
ncbi:MAG TPA: mersacidin/lichenicidin family type 2 lantibiotic [Blastocatellia bacterium]|nr:mersacidin/lichenicidin family type 2 lantibiotic [Blastocatellia bacterium]